MARSGETSTNNKAAHGQATRRGGARRYFKIPPVIDHQAGSFLVDRLRLLGALLVPLYWRRFLLISSLIIIAVGTLLLSGGTQIITTGTIPTQTDTLMPGAAPPAKPDTLQGNTADTTRDVAPNTAPDKTEDAEKLRAQLEKAEEKLRYTERKLGAALAQLRDVTIEGQADQLGRSAALLLALGTGRPYQESLRNVDPDWLTPEDMSLLRLYEVQGFYDANHLARRLSALLEGDTLGDQTRAQNLPKTLPQNLPPALAWLTRNAGGLVEVRSQTQVQLADARHDILSALVADRPAAALRLVDEILEGKTDAPSALRDWRNDLAVWHTLSPVMARLRNAHAGKTPAAREKE